MLQTKDTIEKNEMPEADGNMIWHTIFELFLNKQN